MAKQNEKTVLEYLMIICVVSVIGLGLVQLAGGYMSDATTRTNCELLGRTYIAGSAPGKAVCE